VSSRHDQIPSYNYDTLQQTTGTASVGSMTQARFARDLGLRLDGVNDAMDVIASGVRGCIFTLDDIADDFFRLENRRAGDVFQKLINYNCRIAVVLPEGHGLGERVNQLAREHASHSIVRFFATTEAAVQWSLAGKDESESYQSTR